jgi:hypothetical protein
MAFRFRRRRQAGPGSVVALVLGAFLAAGWSFIQAFRFSRACQSIVAGQPLVDAEATLTHRKGQRVTHGQPRPEAAVFRYTTFGSGERTCEIIHAEGVVVSASSL